MKYNFLKNGRGVYWNDPAGETSGWAKVLEIRNNGEEIADDTVILLEGEEFGEAEVFASEICVPDTSLEDIRNMKPYKERGLWAEYCGERITPSVIYFGSDLRFLIENSKGNGYAYYPYGNALRPVYLSDGTHFRNPELANVSCDYDGVNLTNFRHG